MKYNITNCLEKSKGLISSIISKYLVTISSKSEVVANVSIKGYFFFKIVHESVITEFILLNPSILPEEYPFVNE